MRQYKVKNAVNPIDNSTLFYTVGTQPLSQKDRLQLGYKHLGNGVYQNLNYNPEDKADYQYASYKSIPKNHPQYDPKVGTAYGFYKVNDPNAPINNAPMEQKLPDTQKESAPIQIETKPVQNQPKRVYTGQYKGADGQTIQTYQYPGGTTKHLDPNGNPIISYKKGGLVAKYADGGWVDANGNPVTDPNILGYSDTDKAAMGLTRSTPKPGLAGKFGQTGLYSLAGNTAGSIVQNSINNKKGGESISGDMAGGALRGLGTGAQIGSQFGPEGTAIGAGVGLVSGLAKGYFTGKNDRNARVKEGSGMAQQDAISNINNPYALNKTYNSTDTNTNDYKSKYGITGFKKGGLVEMCKDGGYIKGGKIEGKGTSTSDSIKAKVKEKSFVVPEKNAHIAEEVREEVLEESPKKKAGLKQKGGEEVKLSNGEHLFTPEEVEKIESELGEGFLESLAPDSETAEGKANGGLTSAKAKEILKDGSANGKKLTDKQRRYMGWVAGGKKMADGGEVQDDGQEPDEYEKHRPAYKKDAEITKLINKYVKQGKPYQAAKYLAETEYKGGAKSTPTGTGLVNKFKKPQGQTLVEKLKFDPYKLLDGNIGDDVVVPEEKRQQDTATAPVGTRNETTNPSNQNSPTPGLTNKAKRELGLADVLGYGQAALGTGLLLNQKRPVYEPTNEFKSQLAKSIASSAYGYTPEQKSYLNNQLTEARNGALANVYNVAGGNGGVALNNARAVFNDSYNNRLKTASDDESLRMNKMGLANSMAAQNENIHRQIFEDKMGGFQQNMGTGSQLLSSAVENILGADRYKQYKNAQKDIDRYNLY